MDNISSLAIYGTDSISGAIGGRKDIHFDRDVGFDRVAGGYDGGAVSNGRGPFVRGPLSTSRKTDAGEGQGVRWVLRTVRGCSGIGSR